MPRSGRSASRSGSGSRSAVRNPPQPASRAPAPAPVQNGGSMFGGIRGAIADGLAFGGGSAVAHRAVDAVMGPRTIHVETVPAASQESTPSASAAAAAAVNSDTCMMHSKAFQDCINNYGSEIGKCQFYLDMLNECRRGSALTA